jgi:hypothetical protein
VRFHADGGVGTGVDVDQGLVLLGAWAEMAAVVSILAYFVLRRRSR